MRQHRLWISVALIAATSLTSAATREFDGARHEPSAAHAASARLIVKLREAGDAERVRTQSAADRMRALAGRTRLVLRESRAITARMHVLELASASGETLESMLARLRADPAVEYAEPDRRRYALAVPNDPLFPDEGGDEHGQWFLRGEEASAIDAVTAWDTTRGSTGLVIADIDTGVRYQHPDLGDATAGGRLLPGYDFISPDPGSGGVEFFVANDGNGRDDNPSDPGDWLDSDDLQRPIFAGCPETTSSWHGTRVAGILGAITNNSEGVAGVTWDAWILPVRVLGKCGGYDSDIIAAMLWAAGLDVPGVPSNPYPARILNLSLGSVGTCPNSYVDAMEDLTAAGVLVVAAAGNEGGPVNAPGNCPGVVGVAGLRHAGTKVGFSSLGPEVTVSAPAGNCVNTGPGDPCLYTIDTTVNSGTTTPASNTYTDQFDFNVGTSFSTPIVAGIAALMSSVNYNLTPSQLAERLEEGAQPFPSDPLVPTCHTPAGPNDIQDFECNCTTTVCGAGMANARGAVNAALRPIVAISFDDTIAPGENVTLDGSGSAAACGQSLQTYSWEVVSGTGTIVSGEDEAIAVVIAPDSGSFTVQLTITDDAGLEDFANVVVHPTSANTQAPADAGGAACPTDIVVAMPAIDVTTHPHVGEDLQEGIAVALTDEPASPQDVTLTLTAPGVAVVSDDATQLGAGTLVLPSVDDTASHTVFVQGLALGTTQLTASAEGYESRTVTITVDPSGFVLAGGGFSVETTAANAAVPVDAARLDASSLAYVESQALRPGVPVEVSVTSSNAAVGTIVTSPLSFDANTTSVDAQFDPVGDGTSTIAIATPAGFDTPSEMQSITATVTEPAGGGGGGGGDDGGGGGGGALDALTLGALVAAFARRKRALSVSAPARIGRCPARDSAGTPGS